MEISGSFDHLILACHLASFNIGQALLQFLICFTYFLFSGTSCLRDLVLTVPPAASLGETVQLNCSYHLQGESLYAIKLYKGRDEFLTYAAERIPPLRTFPLKGIHLGVSI